MKKMLIVSILAIAFNFVLQAQNTYCLSVSKLSETNTTLTVQFTLKSFASTSFQADATLVVTGSGAISGNSIIGNSLTASIGNGLSYIVANTNVNPTGTYTFPIVNRALPVIFTINDNEADGLGVYDVSLNQRISKDAGCPAMELSVPLPLDLKAFTAVKNNKVSDLAWETASEKNVSQFEVERSKNGTDFNKIGEVKAVGNSTKLQQYAFVDATPINGTNYYRLKMMDTDGKFKYSSIQSVDFSRPISVKVYPNPTIGDVTLDLDADRNAADVTVELFDVTGKQVYQRLVQPSKDNLQMSIPTANLPTGLYIVTVKNSEFSFQQKISKQ